MGILIKSNIVLVLSETRSIARYDLDVIFVRVNVFGVRGFLVLILVFKLRIIALTSLSALDVSMAKMRELAILVRTFAVLSEVRTFINVAFAALSTGVAIP